MSGPQFATDVIPRQLKALAPDFSMLCAQFAAQAGVLEGCRASRVYLVGDGDSYHAALASELLYEQVARVRCQAMSALQFAEYVAPALHAEAATEVLVVVASASGKTPIVVRALEQARRFGVQTLAVCGTPDTPVTRAADSVILLRPPGLEPSPGIRTYQATLLGMLLGGLRLAERRPETATRVAELRADLARCASAIEATLLELDQRVPALAAELCSSASWVVLGTGPGRGSAAFAAAKLVEVSGVFGVAQDIEEWWHVERFAAPHDMPLLLVAPPGAVHSRAVEIAQAAARLGRRVVVVNDANERTFAAHARWSLPVMGRVDERLCALLYGLFGPVLAYELGRYLGRAPFQSSTPGSA